MKNLIRIILCSIVVLTTANGFAWTVKCYSCAGGKVGSPCNSGGRIGKWGADEAGPGGTTYHVCSGIAVGSPQRPTDLGNPQPKSTWNASTGTFTGTSPAGGTQPKGAAAKAKPKPNTTGTSTTTGTPLPNKER